MIRIIGNHELEMLDPILLLDAFHSDNPDDYIAGFSDHPHRGFETVTYIIEGRMRHNDSVGNEGVIGPGAVQWMTAARGIVHSEMPEQENGLLYGFQLWVNLPAADKMNNPGYQEFSADNIAKEVRNDGSVLKIISGLTGSGTRGPVIRPQTDPIFMDIDLTPGSTIIQDIPETHNGFVYVISGSVQPGNNGSFLRENQVGF